MGAPAISAQAHELETTLPSSPDLAHTRPERPWWRDALRRRLLAAADLLAGASAALVLIAGGASAAAALAPLPAWIVLAKLHGLYDLDHRRLRHLTLDELPRILAFAATGIVALVVCLSATARGAPATLLAALAWTVASGVALAGRALARVLWRRVTPPETTVVAGSGAAARAARRKVELFPDLHLSLLGRQAPLTVEELLERRQLLEAADRVIVACDATDGPALRRLLSACRRRRTKLTLIPPATGLFGAGARLDRIGELPVVDYAIADVSRSTLFLKRVLDILVAAPALLILCPLFALISIAIRLDSRGPVLFRQRRAGLRGAPFQVLKFRTMVPEAERLLPELVPLECLEQPVFKLERDPRVTRIGRLLRRTSLDELPQLVNVLRGQMSLVGPRPEQIELVARYRTEERFRLEVRPGLTGPMQVYGRGSLRFEERLAVERDYIDDLSLRRDLKIIALTLAPVLTGRGAF
jgi:exopolysaccharide biosynthesis polyprenyl glycosylphosphotransferase